MNASAIKIDTLIKNAKVFNNGEQPIIEDVAIADGRIVSRGKVVDESIANNIIDADGQWLMPGLFDIHTHYDLELEVAPGLPESTRHGTTSVVIANCSLGLAFGNQRPEFLQVITKQFRGHGVTPCIHPVDVAAHGVDFAVMGDHAERMCPIP